MATSHEGDIVILWVWGLGFSVWFTVLAVVLLDLPERFNRWSNRTTPKDLRQQQEEQFERQVQAMTREAMHRIVQDEVHRANIIRMLKQIK